jgi:hypothetical protein
MPVNGLIDALVEFEDWHDGDVTFISVGPARFKKDFGPWKEGEKVESLNLDYSRGYIEECDDNGEVIRKCAVKLTVDTDRKPPSRNEDDEE